MRLSRAELMLSDCWECGQAYVALSRVTSLAGLWLRGPPLPENCIKANSKVKTFYSQPDAWKSRTGPG